MTQEQTHETSLRMETKIAATEFKSEEMSEQKKRYLNNARRFDVLRI